MTANNSKSYLGSLNQLVDECNNTYHHSLGRKSIHVNYSGLIEEIEPSNKTPKFKVGETVRITKYKNIFSKGCTQNWSKEVFVIYSVLKTNLWTYKIKDLNGETRIGSFYEKELLLSNL